MTDTTSSPRPDRAARRRPARRRGLGCAVAAVVLVIGGVVAGVLWLPRLVDQLANQAGAAPVVLGDHTSATQIAARRSQEHAQLESYGWVDQAAGVAHIPITRAMALVAEQGLPVAGESEESSPFEDALLLDPGVELFLVDPDVSAQVAEQPAVDLTNVNYQEHVLPIFEQHCAECHGADDPEEGLELTRYRTAMIGSMHGPVIEPGDPDNSYLVEQIVSGQMPKRGEPLSPAEIEIIIAWIAAGAPEN
ncbi:MAG: hypothetical protein DCC55_15295 [Chloroflexi bacterium]|nr:MAG: hypothetical protein DCC55_15295 [Chloroflexota bacterium]